jgi:Mn-dependent DtxR family transcriptional regulator
MDAETATVVLHVSKIEFEHIVRKLLQNELLHYVSFNEIELTEEGITLLSEMENEKKVKSPA